MELRMAQLAVSGEPETAALETSLTTSAGYNWFVRCLSDPSHANVLPTSCSSASATVPGCLLTDLALVHPDPFLKENCLLSVFSKLENASISYETSFSPPSNLSDVPLLLVFESLDTVANIYINGQPPSSPNLTTSNAFHPHAICIPTHAVQLEKNTLRIDFLSIREQLRIQSHEHTYREWNDPVGGISKLRTPQFLAGWDWGPRLLSCSIPGEVRLIRPPVASILDIAVLQDIKSNDGQPLRGNEKSVTADLSFVVDVAIRDIAGPVKNVNVRCVLVAPTDDMCMSEIRKQRGNNRTNHSIFSMKEPMQVSHLRALESIDGDMEISRHRDSVMWNIHERGGDTSMTRVRFVGGLSVKNPLLWWPNGAGEQPLYSICIFVEAESSGTGQVGGLVTQVLDERAQRIGLRKLELIQEKTTDMSMCVYNHHPRREEMPTSPSTKGSLKIEKEEHNNEGRSFCFAVNGRKLFMKGANYIPRRILYSQTTKDEYRDIVQSAHDANMNMLRVWGGGVYEKDEFYDVCDRYGILVWQDFMFSCSLYPGNETFLESCRHEVQYQVSRLRNHPCLALWCGNNELEQVAHEILESTERKKAYDELFYKVIPSVLQKDPSTTQYWPSSPHNPNGYEHGFNNPTAGDTHFWDVWHARKPVSSYLRHRSRFCSEFGMQSYVSELGARSFAGTSPGVLNPYGPIMEAHQKNASGNLIIQEYCQRLFRAPRSYGALAYQSQINQLICMRSGVEHFRRSWPYCAGALYWQLNDCWPCFSWSSIEYGGNWKALHYGARAFYAPLLLSVVHHGEENVGVCNLTSFSAATGSFSIFATWDGISRDIGAKLKWNLMNIASGDSSEEGEEDVTLTRDCSKMLRSLDVRPTHLGQWNPREYVLRVSLFSHCSKFESVATSWLCSPRLCEIPPSRIKMSLERFETSTNVTQGTFRIESSCFAPFVEIVYVKNEREEWESQHGNQQRYKEPTRMIFSDNFFDMYPNEVRVVAVKIKDNLSRDLFKTRLSCRSLVDSYLQ